MLHAKNGGVRLGDTGMAYIVFGQGERRLVMIPGLGDGISTVKGTALPMALAYHIFSRQFTVYMFSRKNRLPVGCTTRDMAREQAAAMEKLGIQNAAVMGVSLGGMVAQYLAIDYPPLVSRLVLAVTLSRPNGTMERAVKGWIGMAERGDYRGLMRDTAEKSYSEAYLRKYRWGLPALGLLGKPKDFTRFLIQARACLTHDAYPALGQIACPTLVIGGERDQIAGPEASREIAERVPDSRLYMYPGLGHAAYTEAPDFNARVLEFMCGGPSARMQRGPRAAGNEDVYGTTEKICRSDRRPQRRG